MTNLQMIEEKIMKLDKSVRDIEYSCRTGLTAEEIQGIHELIQGQISLIASLQLKSDVSNTTSAVNSLAKLVSLVSKPTD